MKLSAPIATPFDSVAPMPTNALFPMWTFAATVTCEEIQAWSAISLRSPIWLDDHMTTLLPIWTSSEID